MLIFLAISPIYACEAPVSNAALSAQVDAAIALYEAYEIPTFRTHTAALEAALACSGQPLTPSLAARLHLTLGLLRWAGGDQGRTELLWTAARVVDPALSPSSVLFPPGSAELALWSGLSQAAAPPIPLPEGTAWWVDGAPSSTRPDGRAALVQAIGADQTPVRTELVLPGASWPPLPVHPPTPSRPLGPWVLGLSSAALFGSGAVLLGDAVKVYRGEAFQAGYGQATPEFSEYYRDEFQPRWRLSLAMVSVGGLGLAATGLWFTISPGGVNLGGSF